MGCSFRDEDKDVVDWFISVFEQFFDRVETADKPEIGKDISKKIRDQIDKHNFFIGILTRRDNTNECLPIWVVQEIEIAKGKDKGVFVFVEEGITKLGIHEIEDTYVPFSRSELSKCVPDMIHYFNSCEEYSQTNLYKFNEVINRITIYADGRGIYDRYCELEVISEDFNKVKHGFSLGESSIKTVTLTPFEKLRDTTRIADRFYKDQSFFYRILEPSEEDVLKSVDYEGLWGTDGFNFSLNFNKQSIGNIIKYAVGFSCKDLFPNDTKQLEDGSLRGGATDELKDWLMIRSDVDKLTIIVQFENGYELKGEPYLEIIADQPIDHEYKFEKQSSLFYDTYKVVIGRTTSGFTYYVKWKP